MLKKALSVVLVGLIFNLVCPAKVLTTPEREAKFAAKVKAEIAKLGTGPDARTKVKLRDKTKIKGYVSEIREDGFTVVDDKDGASAQIQYSQVKKAKGRNNLMGEQIVIGTIIIALIVIGVLMRLQVFWR